MAGVNMSFVAKPELAERVREIARTDGVSPSQAVARAATVGALVPTAARRALRFILEAGDAEAEEELAAALSRAIAKVSAGVLDRKLAAQAALREGEPPSEEELMERAVQAVAAYRRRSSAA
jgi:hypothetical protein